MTSRTTNLIGILLTILAGTYFYFQLCSSCGLAVSEEPEKAVEQITPVAKTATSYPFAVQDGAFALNSNDNYNFNTSTAPYLKPLSDTVGNAVLKLKDYLSENAGKVINITGFYTSDENNTTAFPNLGLARANAVKNHFIENGIPSANLNVFGQLKDEMVSKDDIYLGPVAYSIDTKTEDDGAALKALYEKIKANPIVLHFETAKTSIELTAAQRQKIADISRYLDKVEGATCSVVGHTDNTGKTITNAKVSQGRAEFAKNYLIENGISAAKITAVGKGEKQPIANNNTEEGRAENRRTVITLN